MAYMSINFIAEDSDDLLKLRKVLFSNPKYVSESEEKCNPEIEDNELSFNSDDNGWLKKGLFNDGEIFADSMDELFDEAGISDVQYTCWFDGDRPEYNLFIKNGEWVSQYEIYDINHEIDDRYWVILVDETEFFLGNRNTTEQTFIYAYYKNKRIDKFYLYLGDIDDPGFSGLDDNNYNVKIGNKYGYYIDCGKLDDFEKLSESDLKEKILKDEKYKSYLQEKLNLPKDTELSAEDWEFTIR